MTAITVKQAKFVRLFKVGAKPIIHVKPLEQVKDKRLITFTPREKK